MDYERALQLPCAHGLPVGRGTLRSTPEDFVVREWLGFEADGDGDHWLLTVRKRDANTHWIAKQIARLADIHPRDVGYAGLKDRNAVAEQSLTVPFRSAMATSWEGVSGDGFDVIKAQRHRRKLKRGALKGNDFEIIIRDFTGEAEAVRERVGQIARSGVPNYFGPQRFGNELSNLKRAVAMFGGIQVHDRFERGFALSAARAAIFNAVMSRRVTAGTWNRFIDGDVANLDGSNSIFSVEQIDELLVDRCTALDIHPTGPLWGRGELRTTNAAATLEREVADELRVFCEGLERASLDQERRSLRVSVQSLEHVLEGNVLTLRFRLGRGAFATTVLHELVERAFESSTPESED
ncbi:MAG TPA: tRNA pseudouridine(13) synthase TruD [Steroidobacteraceae bacterium]|nr:tRNA pseudouridine(13) synthase TruD [Steroidobacteraceae bacterium]